ncbi:Alpha/Beta hydrolase protein [Aspergillus cavernicola]|uniref:Alpha/Beta hydrolase protein n=1 Tax=Aspergillus cavernicola TaxID=176166 RepID=A0ABR4HPC1_9EURO
MDSASPTHILSAKLKDTRLPGRSVVPEAGTKYVNAFPHYTTVIEDVQTHFLHARAERKESIPLLMIHRWPGSFWEFSQVWVPLSHPTSPKEAAFDVVVPSMPVFCWSSWPPHAGWTLKDNARIFDILMKRLGYHKYMVQCGDWGQFVGRELDAQYTDSCKLLHLDFVPSPLPENVEYTEREKAVAARVDDWVENHIGYAVCMRTRPDTIGIALHDSPVGILVWVGEKYEAADPNKQTSPFWTKANPTTVSLYYFTGCVMPSLLTYYENVQRIKVPFGYTSFFWDTEPSSKRAVERTGSLAFYKGLSEDLRALAKQEWDKS